MLFRKLATVVRASLRISGRKKAATSNTGPITTQREPQIEVSGIHLPAEILIQIFEHIFRAAHAPESDRKDIWDPIVILSSVCRLWRDVALDAPTLWSFISDAPLAEARARVQRSKDAPLTVSYTKSTRPRNSAAALDSVTVVFEQLRRIRSIRLEVNQDGISQVARMLQNQNAAALETFDVIVHHHTLIMDGTSLVPSAPSLRTLRLENSPAKPAIQMLNPGLHELRIVCKTLDLDPLSLSDVIQLIPQLPKLKHLTLRGAMHAAPEQYTAEGERPATAPSLATFEISESLSSVCAIIRNIELSALQVMKIHAAQFHSESEVSLTQLVFALIPWLRVVHIEHNGSKMNIVADEESLSIQVHAADLRQVHNLHEDIKGAREFHLTFYDSQTMTVKPMIHTQSFTLLLATVAPIELRMVGIDYRGPDFLSLVAQIPSAKTLVFEKSVIVFEGLNHLGSELRARILRNVDLLVLQNVEFSDGIVGNIKECFSATSRPLRKIRIVDSKGITSQHRDILTTITQSIDYEGEETLQDIQPTNIAT